MSHWCDQRFCARSVFGFLCRWRCEFTPNANRGDRNSVWGKVLGMMKRQFGAYGLISAAAMMSFAFYSLICYLTFTMVLNWSIMHGTTSGAIEIAAAILPIVMALGLMQFVHVLRGRSLPGTIQQRIPERATNFLDEMREHNVAPRALLYPGALALLVDLPGPL